MAGLTWLHFSDWHQRGEDFDRRVVRDALIQDIRERACISPDLAQVDFIVFSGDVAYAGKAKEYSTAIEHLFAPVLEAAGLSHNRLFIVPGNHDLDRDAFKYLFGALKQPLTSNSEVQEWFTDPEGITNLLRPFKEYDNFIAEHVDQSQTAYAYLRQFKAGGKCIALIGLNSALLSGRHNEVRDGREVINDDRYLILGEPQIYDLLHNEDFCKADVRIAVMHHPFDWLIKFDRDLVCDRLREACHFVLQGHEHQPRVNIELGPGGDCVIIPAGPSYDRREPEISRCANAYNYVHLDFVTGKGRVYLRRYEDRQGWIKDTATTGDESPGLYTFDLPKDLGKKKEPASMVLETDKPPSGHEQPDSSQEQEQVGRKKLRKDYMEAVRKRYRLLELRGLAPQAAEGAADPALSEVYVPLSLIEGLESQQTFEARKPVRDAQPADTLEDQPEMPEPADEMYSEGEGQIEYVPTRPEKAMREAPGRIVDMWDGLASGPSDQIAILGEAGAGKTTTVRYLALALAGEPGTKADARFAGYLPIIGRLAKYSRRLMEGEPGLSLKRHLCEDPFDRSDFGPLLEQELGAGRCVVILDGLDEASCLREVAEAVQDFTAGYGKNHIVITSRIDAYRQTRLGGFRPLTIRRMEEFEYICQFIDRWYEGRSCDEQPGAQDLKDALYERPKLMELVKNPLMLTIIIHMHWRTTTLPGSSIEVYRATTDTLIKYWRESKYGDDPQSKVGLENLYQDTVRQILKPIAYHMLNGNGLIGEDELVDMLTTGIIEVIGWDEVRAREGSRRWLKLISEESGLLASQGTDRQGKRVFEFMHRRFAEYLAAGYLAERWHADDREFVLNHVHKPQWIEVIELFVAQVGYDSKVVATKVLQVILGLGSPWEGIVWRDRILAGKCLGEGVLVGGEMRGVILRNLVSLLLSRQSGLRAEAVRIFAGLQGTQYQQAGIEHVRALLENERPWAIEVAIAETLLRLGERERSRELLLTLREAASRRGHSSTMARIIELLLEKWKEKTIAWLIDVARKYEGRGLALEVNADPTETTVAATDESFGSVHVGRHLTKAELGTFIDRLTEVLVLPEQQEMAQWVRYRLDESASEIRRLATQGHVERVRRLAAEWLIEYHDEREAGVHVLAELATQGEDSLRAIIALRQLEERESVIRGAWTILAKTLDAANEQVAAMLLAEQGEEEEIEAATVSVELLLSQELNDRQTYHLAETLLNMAGPAHKIGLAALRAIAMSVRHTYRYEAAVAIGKAGKEDKIDEIIDEAYQTLLDIAERWGVLDRVNAILALNDTLYATRRKRDQVDLTLLAGRVVNEVSDKYNALTRLLGARIVPPEESCEIQAVPNHGPKTTRAKWEERAQEAWGRFRRVSEEWLDALPEQSQAHPYRQAAKAYLLAEKGQTDDAICVLQEAAMHPGASARLLRRVSKRLLKLPAREDGLKALGRIPAQSANETLGWLEMAYLLRSSDETDQALEATRKVATVATEF
ncbi:MAG: metallophosphoesterase, partial [Anaerolineae bacterium]|nr:metallophosphoesterase [Anaerolineae bacterium]